MKSSGMGNSDGKFQEMKREAFPGVCQRKSQGESLASKAGTPMTEPSGPNSFTGHLGEA